MFTKIPFDEEICFDNMTTRTIRGIIRIEQGNWWHITTSDNVEIIINPDRVLFIKVLERDNNLTINNK